MSTPLPLFTADPAAGTVHVRLPDPLARLLRAQVEQDTAAGDTAVYTGTPLATAAADDDVMARLEAEIVSDALTAAQADRRAETLQVARTVTDTAVRWLGINVTLSGEDAQALLEWFNRAYVRARRGELAAAGTPALAGVAQSAAHLLGLDVDDDPADLTEIGVLPILFASLTLALQQELLTLGT